MTGLRIARDLELPVDVAGESTAILAKKGAGKSNTAKVIVEETLDHGGVQVIVLDPIGHWWSLRAGADGKPKAGYPVVVFGGMHGDLPLEETAGRLLAQTAVESGQSMVLDVSGLDSNGAMQRFVYELLEELYKLKQATPTPLLLVLEEADEFAPQDPKGLHVPRMVGAANRISKRGRGRGIGMLYVTQRSAALNKNVLDQSDTLIVMRTIGPRDRKAIEGWVQHAQAEGSELVLPSLPSLETGEAWVWTPERGLLQRVKIRKARTFDSSQTPKPGEAAVVADVKPIDVDALGAAIRATVERARENDPAELRKRIRELERRQGAEPKVEELQRESDERLARIRELEARPAEIERIEVPVLNGNQLLELTTAVNAIRTATNPIAEGIRRLVEHLDSEHAAPPPKPAAAASRPAAPPRRPAPAPSPRRPSAVADPDTTLGKGERTVLEVLAEYPEGRTQNELAFLAGYSAKASTIGVILARLRQAGLVEPGQPIRATAEGLAAAGGVRERPTGDALLQQWLQHPRMGDGMRRVLLALVDAYPDPLSHEELCARTGYSPEASTMGVILSKLRKLGLVEKGPRRIAPEFEEAIR